MFYLLPKWRLLILLVVALAASWLVFRPTLKIALGKNIVDDPQARKLQNRPVPILGGVVVFFGIAVGLMFFKTVFYQTALLPVLAASIIMLYVGTIDDILDIAPAKRLLIETLVAVLMVFGSRCHILNPQGLFGLEEIPTGVAIPLTVLTIVGIVNAINMIDGIDGLLPGLGITMLGFLGVLCFLAHDYSNAALAVVTIGSLTTFFLHNVFGKKSKMFLGDGGSMLLGNIISWLVIRILSGQFHITAYLGGIFDFNLMTFCVAVLGIPVFDALRVMFTRIAKHRSPFHADKNHLHHLFIACGFSHLETTLSIMSAAFLIVVIYLAAWMLGASAELQFAIALLLAFAFDFGCAALLRRLSHKKTIPAQKRMSGKISSAISDFVDKY